MLQMCTTSVSLIFNLFSEAKVSGKLAKFCAWTQFFPHLSAGTMVINFGWLK